MTQPLRPDDTILGPARGNWESVWAFLNRPGAPPARNINDILDHAKESYRLAPLVGIDPAIVVAMSALETGNWTSEAWVKRRNPAGLGILGDPGKPSNDLMYEWKNGTDAARGQIVHLMLYAIAPPDEFVPAYNQTLAAYGSLDPRRPALIQSGYLGTVRTIAELGGKWATEPTYGARIAKRGNELFNFQEETAPVPDLNMTKGLIPLDFIEDDILDVEHFRIQTPRPVGYDPWEWVGQRPQIPKFLVIHREQSPPNSTVGTVGGFFTFPDTAALTDLEINCVTGRMRRFVGRGKAPSGWANGVVSAPYGDALAWLNQHGWDLNSVNRDGEACEVTGRFAQPGTNQQIEDPWSEAAKDKVATWIASRAHDYGITWETFPLIPSEGNRSYITWHQEWTIGTGKVCPGEQIMGDTPDLIERARAKMKAVQVGTTTPQPPAPTYATPDVPPFLAADMEAGGPRDHIYNNTQLYAVRRVFTATKDTRRLQKAVIDKDAPVVGPPIKKGESFEGWYLLKAGGQSFILTPYGTRVQTSGLTPKIRIG